MLTPGEDVEITSLRKRGWSISAIARHVGHGRKTVRNYLSGEWEPGVRAKSAPDLFDRFEPYVRYRLVDDQHLWATTLFDEVVGLGYERSYQTFTRQLRDRQLRPHCEPCSASNGRAHVDIAHPPGVEIQWDWLELDDTPWGTKAYVLVQRAGALEPVPGLVLATPRKPGQTAPQHVGAMSPTSSTSLRGRDGMRNPMDRRRLRSTVLEDVGLVRTEGDPRDQRLRAVSAHPAP
jgi:hypothetical protein